MSLVIALAFCGTMLFIIIDLSYMADTVDLSRGSDGQESDSARES